MKFPLIVIALFAAIAAFAQSTSAEDSMDAQILRRLMQQAPDQNLFITRQEEPNEIKRNGVTYSGIIVQLVKTDRPLELINPAAPAEYGSPEDNTARDPISGRVSGLKLFSISF